MPRKKQTATDPAEAFNAAVSSVLAPLGSPAAKGRQPTSLRGTNLATLIDAGLSMFGKFEIIEDEVEEAKPKKGKKSKKKPAKKASLKGQLLSVEIGEVLHWALPNTIYFLPHDRLARNKTEGGEWLEFVEVAEGEWDWQIRHEAIQIRWAVKFAVQRAKEMGLMFSGSGAKTRYIEEAIAGWRDTAVGGTTKDIDAIPYEQVDRRGRVINTLTGETSPQSFARPKKARLAGALLDRKNPEEKKLFEKGEKIINRLIMDMLGDNPHREELRDYIQRAPCGGQALRRGNEDRAFYHFYSPTSCGKTTLLDLMCGGLTNPEAVADDPSAIVLAGKVDQSILGAGGSSDSKRAFEQALHMLVGIIPEIRKELDADEMKRLVGELTEQSRKLYGESHQSIIRCLLICVSNRRLRLGASCDASAARRLRFIHCRGVVPVGKENKELIRVRREQWMRDVALTFMVDGAVEYDKVGEQIPQCVLDDTEEFLLVSGPSMMRFMGRHLPINKKGKPADLSAVLDNYKSRLRETKEGDYKAAQDMSEQDFAIDLLDAGVDVRRTEEKGGRERYVIYGRDFVPFEPADEQGEIED